MSDDGSPNHPTPTSSRPPGPFVLTDPVLNGVYLDRSSVDFGFAASGGVETIHLTNNTNTEVSYIGILYRVGVGIRVRVRSSRSREGAHHHIRVACVVVLLRV